MCCCALAVTQHRSDVASREWAVNCDINEIKLQTVALIICIIASESLMLDWATDLCSCISIITKSKYIQCLLLKSHSVKECGFISCDSTVKKLMFCDKQHYCYFISERKSTWMIHFLYAVGQNVNPNNVARKPVNTDHKQFWCPSCKHPRSHIQINRCHYLPGLRAGESAWAEQAIGRERSVTPTCERTSASIPE